VSVTLADFGLAIESPLATPSAANFRPLSWPPTPDWPVMIDAHGNVVSRYGDSIWRLFPWAKQAISINFGDGPSKRGPSVDVHNANLLRQVVAWWIWGPRGVRNAGTLSTKFGQIRPLFVLCSNNRILASDLMRFPAVAEQIANELAPSSADGVLIMLHELYQNRESLGFTLLDKEGLCRLETTLPDHEQKQTAYIPPRIWMYQVGRLRECLDDFLAHREQVEACYKFCLNAYAINFGSLKTALISTEDNKSPFSKSADLVSRSGLRFYGRFELTAARFGIDKLLARWVGSSNGETQSMEVQSLTTYFRLVSKVGLAYLLNFSLMRVSEGSELKVDCLKVEHDPRFGDIYVLCGPTTKTKQDGDARWPTSPSAKVAVEAMTYVAHLQLICLKAHPQAKITAEDVHNPYLIQRCVAPWISTSIELIQLPPRRPSYGMALTNHSPKLFDVDQLRITEADLQVARLITPTLNPETYSVGKVWPLAWHQLRRTGAVNMQASGLISDASLQYLLKHVTRAMSLYYGQGYSRLRLNDQARILYVRTMHEVLSKEFGRLLSARFISPHGNKRKFEIVRLIDPSDAKTLSELAKKGQIACRQILLGYCMNREPCPYGGIDSVAHCGGGDSESPCPDVLYDKNNSAKVKGLDSILDERLAHAPIDSPLRESLLAQKKSVENYQNVTRT
jgi:hypothetical protein